MRNPTERYHAAAHAMQSGVRFMMENGHEKDCEPKHLRVGINTAHADIGSLARLLISKGVITEEEYLEALADGMEAEQRSFEAKASEISGIDIRLG